ncbi:hypothetical protein COEREDRAFT_17358 [Coemansia reversa NRRL 1564]|uniref:Uncharacterized protein n=1 Tax=Coemansia reversa (strain ATCC 12441 / NRRL 1564) TaxID=763665 RepID=A0A2G5B455_COERN|nr:hypothetical protein COEREDRAFT_17358 [Coemansia reversa NRRL 1564]|eukprot:PIA13788.1 hypothetical protein COEREDRAFT_17358 [Coemansia reversa NRRL 1564]
MSVSATLGDFYWPPLLSSTKFPLSHVAEQPPWPQTAEGQGATNVIVPPTETLYESWQSVNTVRQEPQPYSEERHSAGDPEIYHNRMSAISAQKPESEKRPWWMRLFLDAVVVPFVQGFMLNLGIHCIRHWRNNGGLVGVFRRRTVFSKSK